MDVKHHVKNVENWTLHENPNVSNETLLAVWEPVAVAHSRFWGVEDLPDGVVLGNGYLNGKKVGGDSYVNYDSRKAGSSAFTKVTYGPIVNYTVKYGIYFFQDDNKKVYRCLISKMSADARYVRIFNIEQLNAFIKKHKISFVG